MADYRSLLRGGLHDRLESAPGHRHRIHRVHAGEPIVREKPPNKNIKYDTHKNGNGNNVVELPCYPMVFPGLVLAKTSRFIHVEFTTAVFFFDGWMHGWQQHTHQPVPGI
jgi:hypothetical protein